MLMSVLEKDRNIEMRKNMSLRIQKIVYYMSLLILVGILVIAGVLIGMHNEKERIKQQDQAEVVTDIAVVNLDEGIYEDGVKKYYSTILMDLEADNLTIENLESARQGILDGSYAAYILIPAEFSQNATSINNIPTKAVLEFAMNPNLREDVSRLTMANVKNFEIGLNTNMSYMYVQALLAEFHNVQDLSGVILNNDMSEMERLLAVDANALLVLPEYEEVDRIDPDLEEIEFHETFDKNEEILDSIYENYESFVKEGEDAFTAMKEKEENVVAEVEAFYEAVSEIDIAVDENGDSVIEPGLENLETYITDYDVEFEKQKKQIVDIVSILTEEEIREEVEQEGDGSGELGDGNTSVEDNINGEESNIEDEIDDGFNFDVEIKPIPQIIKENIESCLQESNTLIENGNAVNRQLINETQEIIGDLRNILSEHAGGEGQYDGEQEPDVEMNAEVTADIVATLERLEELEGKVTQIQEIELIDVDDVYSADIALEPFQILTEEVNKIPKMDIQEYSSIFEEEVVIPLREEIEGENQNVQKAGETMLMPLEEYITELVEFDLFSLYDYDAMDKLLEEFGDNIFALENQIVDVHGEYEEYVSDAVEDANDTMAIMQEELEDAYHNTAGNVDKEVSLAKEYRESMNALNTDILGSFQQKLPYTRVGQLEYVQAYDFMVKPIQMTDASISRNRTTIWHDSDMLRNIFIGMIVTWCMCICTLLFMRIRNFSKDASDNE